MMLTLFEGGRVREQGWMRPMESSFAFLNRSDRPEEEQVRRLLESWFRKYPTSGDQHLALRERFQSDTADHVAAFFELYCYTLLHRQRFVLTIEPSLQGVSTRIDFLACKSKKRPRCFRLEAKVVTETDEDAAIQRNLVSLGAGLNKIDSPIFRFRVGVLQGSREPLPIKAIQHDVRRWLDSLDPAEVTSVSSRLRLRSVKRYGQWELSFTPSMRPHGEHSRENVSSMSLGGWAGSHDRVSDKLGGKASKYGTLDLPFVIAVDVLAARDLIVGVRAALHSADARTSFWAAHPQVSAVLAVDELLPWACARNMPILWHNPQPTHRLDMDLWQGPQRVWDEPHAHWTDVPGQPIHELLRLPAIWPATDQRG